MMDGGKPTPIWRPAHLSRRVQPDDSVPMSARVNRLGVFVVSAVAFACALPAVASATDYCVGSNTSCAPADHRDKFQNALNDAAATPDADRILLGAETYTAGTVAGYVYNAPGSRVEIVGAGVGKTVLTGQTGVSSILALAGGSGSSVSDVSVRMPDKAGTGLETENDARRIEVTQALGATLNGAAFGVYLGNGATLEDSTVTLTSASTGVFIGAGHVSRSAVNADTAITVNDGSIERSRVEGSTAVRAYGGASSIVNSRIVAGEDCGICVSPYGGVDKTTVNADGVTIVSPGGVGKGVVADTAYEPGWSVEVNLKNSAIRGVPTALVANAPGTGRAELNVSFSDYDPSGNAGPTGNAAINAANISNVGDAGFVNAAGGDYRLLPGSPLIDAGSPATAQGLDLDGNPLVTDGNGDGIARRDIGAFEAPAVPAVPGGGRPGGSSGPDTEAPLITGFRATRSHHRTRFHYTLSERARVSLKIQRRLHGRHARYRTIIRLTRSGKAGGNLTRFSGRIGKRALRPGRYRVRITAIDAAGNRSAPRSARFRIAR